MASVCPVVLRMYGPFVLVVVPPEGNGNLIDEKIGVFVVKGYKKSCAFEIKTCIVIVFVFFSIAILLFCFGSGLIFLLSRHLLFWRRTERCLWRAE